MCMSENGLHLLCIAILIKISLRTSKQQNLSQHKLHLAFFQLDH